MNQIVGQSVGASPTARPTGRRVRGAPTGSSSSCRTSGARRSVPGGHERRPGGRPTRRRSTRPAQGHRVRRHHRRSTSSRRTTVRTRSPRSQVPTARRASSSSCRASPSASSQPAVPVDRTAATWSIRRTGVEYQPVEGTFTNPDADPATLTPGLDGRDRVRQLQGAVHRPDASAARCSRGVRLDDGVLHAHGRHAVRPRHAARHGVRQRADEGQDVSRAVDPARTRSRRS